MFGPLSLAQYHFLHGFGCGLFQAANSLKYLPLPANLFVFWEFDTVWFLLKLSYQCIKTLVTML